MKRFLWMFVPTSRQWAWGFLIAVLIICGSGPIRLLF